MSTITKMIRSFLGKKQSEWDSNLCCLAGAYRSAIQESTGFSPNKLMLGRETRMPAELVFGDPPNSEDLSYGDYVQQLRADLRLAQETARVHLKQASQRQKDNYDVRLSQHTFEQADLVWFLNEVRTPQKCPKLQKMWLGPCIITKKYSDLNFEIQLNRKGNKRTVHHNKLKPYCGFTLPGWLLTVRGNLKKDLQE